MNDSSLIDWKFDHEEIFDFLMARFDIQSAKRILSLKPRPIVKIDPSVMKDMLTVVRLRENPAKIDLSIPLIIAEVVPNERLIIDGWHRVKKALTDEIKRLPAVLLTVQETAKIRLS